MAAPAGAAGLYFYTFLRVIIPCKMDSLFFRSHTGVCFDVFTTSFARFAVRSRVCAKGLVTFSLFRMKAAIVTAVLVAIALGGVLGLLLSGPRPATKLILPSTSKSEERVRAGSTGISSVRAVAPANVEFTSGNTSARNLFADYQSALGSSDRRVIELGLAAWRVCAGFVGEGTNDINDHIATVMPSGLSHKEEYKRSQFARASAARCADFALQANYMSQVRSLSEKALALGSATERLMRAIETMPDNSPPTFRSLREASCKVVQDFPQSRSAIRQVILAVSSAAQLRSSHMLNQVERKNRRVAIGLANCDLDPASCGRYSSTLGSACVQSGKCDYANELDYWRTETSPANYAAAQNLRLSYVAAVREGNCDALFE